MESCEICKPHCFISNNFAKLTAADLKPTLVNFYHKEELCYAKETLLKAVSKAMDECGRGSDLRRMPKRTGDNKIKNTVDDLLKLFTIIDAQNLSTRKCVAADLSRVPFLNADSINMVSMARKMESLESRMAKMEEAFVSTK